MHSRVVMFALQRMYRRVHELRKSAILRVKVKDAAGVRSIYIILLWGEKKNQSYVPVSIWYCPTTA